MKFYKCNKCGNIFEVINDAAIVPSCCKEHMEILDANTNEEGSKEKHIPVFRRDANKVTIDVGSVLHPTEDNHYIEWIILETSSGIYKRILKPGDKPSITFLLSDDDNDVINIYAYCNIHGLWARDLRR